MMKSTRFFAGVAIVGLLQPPAQLAWAQEPAAAQQPAAATPFGNRCAALAKSVAGLWPERDTQIISADYRPAGPAPNPPGPPGMNLPPVQLPAHCEIIGSIHDRTGVDGQHYAIKFHLRLPEQWNGRFLFQGGGGLDGNLGDAVGRIGFTGPPALGEGYAVLSEDGGHDNTTNSNPQRGGDAAFGFDPQARAEYGGTSLKYAALDAKAAIKHFYGRNPSYSYFVGCSKGGQEGMALAQRYPTLFDGIIASDPGFSLPRAAVAEVWNTQAFASIPQAAGQPVTLASIASSFSDADLGLVQKAVLGVCDGLDGLKDGIVGDFSQCTSERVLPALAQITCKGPKTDSCITQTQVDALRRVHEGPHNSKGEALYTTFPWDAGWVGWGWRAWNTGMPDGKMPAANIALGAPALATVFSTPPTALVGGPQANLQYELSYSFDGDAPKIYATTAQFPRSGWEDNNARSPDVQAFRAHGGKMIVAHGVSDPVFALNDTLAWWNEVNQRQAGHAADFVRIFPVPGMAHCAGGPATDQFDAFSALVNWVEKSQAPDRLIATAGPMTPWPGRTRPLCSYPLVARFDLDAKQNPETASAFVCGPAAASGRAGERG